MSASSTSISSARCTRGVSAACRGAGIDSSLVSALRGRFLRLSPALTSPRRRSLNNHFAYDRPTEKQSFELSVQMMHRFAREAEVRDSVERPLRFARLLSNDRCSFVSEERMLQSGSAVSSCTFHSTSKTRKRRPTSGWSVWRSTRAASNHGTSLGAFACAWATAPRSVITTA